MSNLNLELLDIFTKALLDVTDCAARHGITTAYGLRGALDLKALVDVSIEDDEEDQLSIHWPGDEDDDIDEDDEDLDDFYDDLDDEDEDWDDEEEDDLSLTSGPSVTPQPSNLVDGWVNVGNIAAPPEDGEVDVDDEGIARVTLEKDESGSILIPTAIVETIQAEPGQMMYVAETRGRAGLVVLQHFPSSGHIATIPVREDHTLRVTRYALNRGGLTDNNLKLRTTGDAGGIVINPAN